MAHSAEYAASARRYPLIIGSDLLYEQAAIAPLVATILAHLAPGGYFVLMAPASEDLSRTKLVAELVAALRATGGAVRIDPCHMKCYQGYDYVMTGVAYAEHPLQRITYSLPANAS